MGWFNGLFYSVKPWEELSDEEKWEEIFKVRDGEYSYYAVRVLKNVPDLTSKTRNKYGLNKLTINKTASPPAIHSLSHCVILVIAVILLLPVLSFLKYFVLYPLMGVFL